MSESFNHLDYFVAAPAGAPDEVLGSMAALVATKTCSVEKCNVSSTCNPFASPERYVRRARLGDCSTCAQEVSIVRSLDEALGTGNHDRTADPDIIDVDPVSPGSFMRKEAIDAMSAFWAVVDEVAEPNEVFDIQGRKKIAEAIRQNYGTILGTAVE